MHTKSITVTKSISVQILQFLLKHRRLLDNSESSQFSYLSSHLRKVDFFVEHNKPIHFILPAFPAKSPNSEKVLGILPDMGERVSLNFLQSLCDYIKQIFPYGAHITICSDGRVFNDLVGVTDEAVSAYSDEIHNIIAEDKLSNLNVFSMENVFPMSNFCKMREHLFNEYATPLDLLKREIKINLNDRNLFNGIHRFLVEDFVALEPDKSRNYLKKECKELAYKVIQRSNAWSTLIANQFSNALRLSIHPQQHDSEKIGIHMISTDNSWGTPWHNVAVYDGNQFHLMKRSRAEQMGASLVYHQNRPSHFTLVNTDYQET
jgi:pyoverdine/dityrosine biosynthesis protein Dit1